MGTIRLYERCIFCRYGEKVHRKNSRSQGIQLRKTNRHSAVVVINLRALSATNRKCMSDIGDKDGPFALAGDVAIITIE
jgi:hypothetical protein